MKKFVFQLTLLVTFFSSGCIVRLQTQPLAAYDQALKLPGSDRPKIFMDGSVKLNDAMTAYAIVIGSSVDAPREDIIKNIWWKASELKADVVVIKDSGSQYAGSIATSNYIGYGVSAAISAPLYNKIFTGICLRLNPSKVGFHADQNQMIDDIYSDSLRDAGILEGDKIISINDVSYSSNMPELLSLIPSQDVKITVIRPGTGKLSRSTKTLKNGPSYLNYTDALIWQKKPIPMEQKKCSTAVNCQ